MDGVRMLQVPLRSELPSILEFFHSSRLSGHFAVKRTLERLQEVYHWIGMVKEVTSFIRACSVCQTKKAYNRTSKLRLLTNIPVTEPFARVGMDLMGPLITTSEGHRYVIVASHYLTKWVEVKALMSKDCENIAQFFFDEVMMRHSSPIEILTNNGTEFCNALMDVLAIHMRVKHTTTSPYHPQCKGLTERFNRTLCSLIEKNGEYDAYWHMMLPSIIFAYNTSVHASTRLSPFELLYGRKPRLAVAPIPSATQVMEPVDLH